MKFHTPIGNLAKEQAKFFNANQRFVFDVELELEELVKFKTVNTRSILWQGRLYKFVQDGEHIYCEVLDGSNGPVLAKATFLNKSVNRLVKVIIKNGFDKMG